MTKPWHGGAARVWLVRNKIDLIGRSPVPRPRARAVEISASRGDGLSDLIAALVEFARGFFGSGEGGLISRVAAAPVAAGDSGLAASRIEAAGEGEELAAEELANCRPLLGAFAGPGRR